MLTTLEVRWFRPGSIPEEVKPWFDFRCPGELLDPPEQREDLYLYTPDWEAINIKQRWGNLELKLRQAELGTRTFGSRQDDAGIFRGWEGKIERWQKWVNGSAEISTLVLPEIFKTRPWVAVQKLRRKRLYQDICFELTELGVSNHAWWTIAFEMTEGNGQEVDVLEAVVSLVSKSYPGPQLLEIHSCSYPSWLWTQFSDKAEAVNGSEFLVNQQLNLKLV